MYGWMTWPSSFVLFSLMVASLSDRYRERDDRARDRRRPGDAGYPRADNGRRQAGARTTQGAAMTATFSTIGPGACARFHPMRALAAAHEFRHDGVNCGAVL